MLLSSRMAQLTKARPAQALMVQPAARDSDSDSVAARPVNREQLGLRLRLRLARTGGGCRDPSFRYESHNLSLNSVVPLAGTGPGLPSGISAGAQAEVRQGGEAAWCAGCEGDACSKLAATRAGRLRHCGRACRDKVQAAQRRGAGYAGTAARHSTRLILASGTRPTARRRGGQQRVWSMIARGSPGRQLEARPGGEIGEGGPGGLPGSS